MPREVVWGQLSPRHRGQKKGKPSRSNYPKGKGGLKSYRKAYAKWYNKLPEVKAKKEKYSRAKSATMKRLGLKHSQVLGVGRTRKEGRKPRGKRVKKAKLTRLGKRTRRK